jgi:predicted transcriptional regulator
MINKVNEFIKKNNIYKDVIKSVYNNPYSEKKIIADEINLNVDEVVDYLSDLEEELIILELNSQANSKIESRVLKKIYLINPEIEQELKSIL